MNRRDFTLGLGAVAAAAAGGVTAAERPWLTATLTYEVPTGFTAWGVDDVVGLTLDRGTVSIYKNGEYLMTVKQESGQKGAR